MAVTNDSQPGELDLYGIAGIASHTALAWGTDGPLYVGELKGILKALTVAFGDRDPSDPSNEAGSYVTAAETLTGLKDIPDCDDDGTPRARATRRSARASRPSSSSTPRAGPSSSTASPPSSST